MKVRKTLLVSAECPASNQIAQREFEVKLEGAVGNLGGTVGGLRITDSTTAPKNLNLAMIVRLAYQPFVFPEGLAKDNPAPEVDDEKLRAMAPTIKGALQKDYSAVKIILRTETCKDEEIQLKEKQ